jgi:biopolymer transport protein ExbB/TolQ
MKITPPEMGSYAGGAVAIGTSLTLTQVGILVGIVTALLTFALNAWCARKKNARDQMLADFELRSKQLITDLEVREREMRLAQLAKAGN